MEDQQKDQNEKNQDLDENEQDPKNKEIDIMEMLHKKKMYIIEQCFQKVGKGLDIKQFCKVMLEHLDYDKNDEQLKEKITLSLVDLFREIDVNGDQTMEWEEFSDHIISLGLLRNDRSFKNVIKNYYPSETIIDKEKHETGIERVYYFDKLKQVIVLEKDSPRFKVYRAQDCELICEVNAHKCAVLAAEFIQNHHMVATSSNDLTINFWDSNSYSLKQIVSVPEIQLCMRYAKWNTQNNPAFLYTGGSDAIIHIYDATTLKEKGTMSGWNPFFKKDSQQYGHAGPIGDILPIQSQLTLVTGGLDANICLWDIVTHSPKKELRGHEKGVYSLDWSDWSTMNQCLISAGLDHEAFVWNTYVKEKIFLLRGHNHPLIGVKCLPETPQVITADINGMVKIWDVRNFLCMQTFNVPTEELNSFILTSAQKKRIIFGSRRLYYYEYDEPKDQKLTDEKMCLRVLYNDVMLCFITLHPDVIKVWDARDGSLISVFRELSHAELTCCVLDCRQRKLFVGDSDGRIFTVNIKNGAKMKKFEKHTKMVTDIVHWTSSNMKANVQKDIDIDLDDGDKDDTRRIVTSSREETVNIHDEDCQDGQKSLRYKMKQHRQGVNCLALKSGTEYLASVSDDGGLVVTNLVSYRQENYGKPSDVEGGEMKKVIFLDPHNCLACSDSLGNLFFFGVSPSKLKTKKLIQKSYMTTPQTKQKEEKFPVTHISYHNKKSLILLADEFGSVTGWDVSQMLKKLSSFKEDNKKQIKKYKAANKDASQQGSPKNGSQQQQQQQQQDQDDEVIQNDKNFFETQIDIVQKQKLKDLDDESIFEESDIVQVFQKKKAHDDGITWIEMISQYDCFATSSFDCQVHIWKIDENNKGCEKIGSLILGHETLDNKWQLKINEEQRKIEALIEAKQIMEECQSVLLEEKKSQQQQKKEKQDFYSRTQKIMQAQHEKQFKLDTKKQDKDDHEELLKQEEQKKKYDQKQWKAMQTIKFMKMYISNIKQDNKSKLDRNELDYEQFTQSQGIKFLGNLGKDVFLDEDEEEEDDNNILQELMDHKNSQPTGAYTSKNAFKSKGVSKSGKGGMM